MAKMKTKVAASKPASKPGSKSEAGRPTVKSAKPAKSANRIIAPASGQVVGNHNPPCISPNCGRTSAIRGLCGQCYGAARALIQNGTTSNEELQKLGLIQPLKSAQIRERFSKLIDQRRAEIKKK